MEAAEWLDWYRLKMNRAVCNLFDHRPTTINDPHNPGMLVRCCGRCGTLDV